MSLDGDLKNQAKNITAKASDDSIRQNAENASGAGLEVRVTREYDGVGLSGGRTCQWCLDRCGVNMTLEEAYEKGAFQRHPGCGCIIEYTSAKGVVTVQNQKGAWSFPDEIEARKRIGLESDFYAEETMSRVKDYLVADPKQLVADAKNGGHDCGCYNQAISKSKKALQNSIKNHVNEVEEHTWKILHPEKKMTYGDPSNPKDRTNAIEVWERHRRRNAHQAAIEIEVWRSKYAR